MHPKRIAIGADHAGFPLKEQLKQFLQELGYEVEDQGVYSAEPSDYPDTAYLVASQVANGSARFGILICATGVGMSMVANKVSGVRAAHASEPVTARLSREHNDANILCLGGRMLGLEVAKATAQTFLETPFSGEERHRRRIAKIHEYESKPSHS